jgi:type III secretion protein Q
VTERTDSPCERQCEGRQAVLRLRINLGRAHVSCGELDQLKPGAVLTLDEPSDGEVQVYAGARLLARGQMVDLDGRLGVRVRQVGR